MIINAKWIKFQAKLQYSKIYLTTVIIYVYKMNKFTKRVPEATIGSKKRLNKALDINGDYFGVIAQLGAQEKTTSKCCFCL